VAVNEQDSDGMMPFVDQCDNDEAYVKSDLGFELWKARELKRILRDRQLWDRVDAERKEVEKRRNMSEQERMAENLKEHLGEKK